MFVYVAVSSRKRTTPKAKTEPAVSKGLGGHLSRDSWPAEEEVTDTGIFAC